jgi:integrase
VSQPPKLLDRVREAIRGRHYSRRTEEAYVAWIRRYIVFHRKTHPACGRASRAVAIVLSREEIGAILKQLTGTERLVVMLLYGARLGLEECLELRVKALDFDRHQIIVRQGKGRKDRVTMLPAAAREALRGHLIDVRGIHETDLARGFGQVVLPFALDRKFPTAATEWRWQFVFPASRVCRDPRFGPPTRHHLHESVVQKAVAQAARPAGITKRVGPHTPFIRHAFAGGRLRHSHRAGAARAS